MNPAITAVIPSYGNHSGLKRVLDRFELQDLATEAFEVVVVVDRNDPDPSAATAAVGDRPYLVRELRGAVAGASANRNTGWRAADAPLVLFVDNDTMPEPALVSEHLAWHRRGRADNLAVLGHVRWAREVRVTTFMRWLDNGIQFDYPSIRGIDAGWGRFYSANISVTTALLERVDGFDQGRFPYGYEDLDLAYRARPLGLRVFYNRNAVVEHLREYDLEFFRRRVRRIAVAEHEFTLLHPDIPPFFFGRFSAALESPPADGRGRFLARWVSPAFPLLGPLAWTSADLYFRQALAPDFLDAWSQAELGRESAAAPNVAELA